MCHDDWVNLAMVDDSLVVHLLLGLNRSLPPPPPPPLPPYLNLRWTVRQRRSRSVPKNHHGGATRASPTTPLSWSGATSASGGALDGYEDSSPTIKAPQTSRSKVANPTETSTAKKSRRKKTLSELKEEENRLLKERRSLKSELASLHLTVEKHRATNQSLKRMKLDVESRQNSSAAATTSEESMKAAIGPSQFVKSECHPYSSVSQKIVTHDDSPVYGANPSPKTQEIGNQGSTFVLPDLNLPVDEDFNTNAMH